MENKSNNIVYSCCTTGNISLGVWWSRGGVAFAR